MNISARKQELQSLIDFFLPLRRFKPMPELDLDTVVEERSEFDAEVNAIELLNTPEDPNHLCVINHPVSFKSFRFGYGASGELLNKRNYNYASKPVGSPVPKKNSEEKDKELYFDFSNDFQISSSERESSPNHSLSKASAASTSSAIIPIVSDSVIVINECSEKSSEDERNDLKQSAAITSLISGSELRVPSTRGQFIIPSVSVQPYFDDASDDSISFIDKSEEVELVSDSDCYKSKGETKCQIESNEEQHENIVKESVLQLDEISQRKHDISSNEIDENNSSSFKLLNTCPERNHKPTELDFTNSELGPNYCNTLSKQSCNIMIMNNYQKSIQEKVRTDYESEFYDSDEV